MPLLELYAILCIVSFFVLLAIGLRWLMTGDVIRIDLNAGRCDALVAGDEIARRQRELPAPPVPPSQSPWEELYRHHTGQLVDGATLDMALKYRRIAERTPRHNH